MKHHPSFSPISLPACAAALLCASLAQAQTLPLVTITGRAADAPVNVGGFGETPIAKLPLQAAVLSADRLLDAGITALSGLTDADASVSDAYNAAGYVSYLKIRGYDLDNRFNYRRDGMPINAETALNLANKSSVEIFKGTSGIQAGTSAPGGLVNLIVKRPTSNLTTLTAGVSQRGTVDAALDWSRRMGAGEQFGLRVNVEAAQLKPDLRDAQGNRQLFAVAGDWRVAPQTLIEAEFEWNRQSQPSQPGFSLLGDKLPSAQAIDPRINLNNQPWSQPVVFDNQHASLRIQQRLNADWTAEAHLATQHLKSDDRLAYAYGCTAADGSYYGDRYCPDGTFDMYDFRSENERRDTDALNLSLAGKFYAAGMKHELQTGVLASRFKSRFQVQAYNWVGTGNIDGSVRTPADSSLTNQTTNRDEHSTEFYARDAVHLSTDWQAWAGLRHTRLSRDSVQTDGSQSTHYTQALTTPWLGLSVNLSPQLLAYGSWGEGMESDVTPNKPRYTAPGQALAALKSRQFELGLKAGSNTVDWSVAYFDISQPVWRDIGACVDTAPGSCAHQADGTDHHQGIEAQADLKWNAGSGGGLLASAMKLKARREGSADPTLNGLRPVNVSENNLRLQGRQNIEALPGLQLQMGLIYEGPRAVLPDNSLQIGGWTRLDAGIRLDQNFGQHLATWRVGVDNLSDRRAWRESPYQYGHVYLYPLAPRTWRTSFEMSL
ncbi:TonB-dependent siderophore receptor [Roseateles koreensis]|uniref:TonB-dependent receptor n=1 Tax=Roseateles koreensis TaxID=2987526 RepID=A0ABT5KUW0_9BURK|nr:TonB-dependent receptor [Roseateles koreensis]MDC8786720.1 TonB-dependent receptor [Roseateles koreensis]